VTDIPHTCQYCKHAPATCLIIVDMPSVVSHRLMGLACEPCTEQAAKDWGSIWRPKQVSVYGLELLSITTSATTAGKDQDHG
jgi:hypothetical protein